MIFSKYLLVLVFLPVISVGMTPVLNVGGRPLNSGLFTIISSNDPSRRLDLTFARSSDSNPIVAFLPAPSPGTDQKWSFIATGAPNTFQIQNAITPPVFLSCPSGITVQFAQAVIHSTPTAFIISALSPGSPFVNIIFNRFALTYWPAPTSGLPSPLTFENPGGTLAAFQNWTLIPG